MQTHTQNTYLLSCHHSQKSHARTYSLAYKESTYKSYNRAFNLFTAFFNHYTITLHCLQKHHMLELICLLLTCPQPPYNSTSLEWELTLDKETCPILRIVLSLNIWLPITWKILHQTCIVLSFVLSDHYLVMLYKSLLTLAFHWLLSQRSSPTHPM